VILANLAVLIVMKKDALNVMKLMDMYLHLVEKKGVKKNLVILLAKLVLLIIVNNAILVNMASICTKTNALNSVLRASFLNIIVIFAKNVWMVA
jgi:hypothetical protein